LGGFCQDIHRDLQILAGFLLPRRKPKAEVPRSALWRQGCPAVLFQNSGICGVAGMKYPVLSALSTSFLVFWLVEQEHCL